LVSRDGEFDFRDPKFRNSGANPLLGGHCWFRNAISDARSIIN
jgi:hypothetical protein